MCKKAWLIGCLIWLGGLQLTAQPLTTESYIQQYKELAIAEMKGGTAAFITSLVLLSRPAALPDF